MIRIYIQTSLILTVFLSFIWSGCAYYNYFYNAKKYFREAEEQRKESADEASGGRGRRRGMSSYERCIEAAGRMLEYYPNSKWEDDALLLLAKAFYWAGKHRNAIGKVDELAAKYTESPYLEEAQLWKGMALLQVAQSDSARQIFSTLFLPDKPEELSARAHYALGEYHYEKERWEAALNEYRHILRSNLEDEWIRSRALLRIGDCLSLLEKHEEAIELYDEVLSGKLERRPRFEATFQRAVVQRKSGHHGIALQAFEKLLKDAAFQDEFPRIELEAARCERMMGKIEDARERLEMIIEAEKRGEIAAQAHYELGLLYWNNGRNFAEARKAMQEVKSADRSSPLVERADSLLSEYETLSRYWWSMRFLERQFGLIDSARTDLRPFLPDDSVFVDSVEIALKEKRRERRRGRDRDFARDPLQRMVEEAMAEEDSLAQDTLETAEVDTTAPLDSTAIEELNWKYERQRIETWFDLAGYHLLGRSDYDSAGYYFRKILLQDIESERWGRTIASLAFISKSVGDTTTHDSLYRELLERFPEGPFGERARKVLGIDPLPAVEDTIDVLFRQAEDAWVVDDDPQQARLLYLTLAELTDSSSDARAGALYAAAYLSRRYLGEDSVATELFQAVVDDFGQNAFGRSAKKQIDKFKGGREERTIEDAMAEREDEFGEFGDEFMRDDFPEEYFDEGRVYLPGEVDEIPNLATSRNLLQNYMRSYYPMAAMDEGIHGRVELEFTIDEHGDAVDVEVLSVDPEGRGFEDAAEQVLQRLRYRPGRYRGFQVAVRIRQLFEFGRSEQPDEEKDEEEREDPFDR